MTTYTLAGYDVRVTSWGNGTGGFRLNSTRADELDFDLVVPDAIDTALWRRVDAGAGDGWRLELVPPPGSNLPTTPYAAGFMAPPNSASAPRASSPSRTTPPGYSPSPTAFSPASPSSPWPTRRGSESPTRSFPRTS